MQPQAQQTQTSTAGSLDPQVVALAKSIRQVESGGNFQAQGKSGEYGAYQFTEPTWNATSSKYGVNVPLAQATPEQQNEVAYKQLKEWKDKGYNVGEIASMWNSGKPDAYLNNNVGINDHGVAYNTPEYAKKVATTYQSMKQGSQTGYQAPGTQPQSQGSVTGYEPPKPPQIDTTQVQGGQQQQPQSFLQEAGQNIKDAIGGAGTALKNEFSQPGTQGHISPFSGPLQVAGSLAKGATDLTNTAIKHTPIVGQAVQGIEKLVGQGAGWLANSPAGKPIVDAVSKFAKDHPELAGDIGAGLNIATAIPIFKGLSSIKNIIGMGQAGEQIQSVAQKGVVNDMTNAFSKTKTLSKAFARNGGSDTIENAVKTLGKDAVPDIVDGKYATEEAFGSVGDKISEIDDELDSVLNKGNVPEISSRIPLSEYKQQAMQDAVDQLKNTKPIEDYFDRLKLKYGDYPTAQQMNEAKRIVAKNISEAGFNSPTYDTDKVVRSALQQAVEDWGKATGNPAIDEINARMGNLIKYQNLLKSLNMTAVKVGGIRKLAQRAIGGALGVGAARMVGGGIPGEIVGGYIGEQSAGMLGKKSVGGLMGRLLTGSK